MVKNLFSVALTFHLAVIVGGRTAGDGITIDILGGDGLSLWPDVPDSIPQVKLRAEGTESPLIL